MQLCPWLEPPLGLDWEPVRVLVADILGGKPMRDRLKVVSAPKGPLAPAPTMFGWAPDGEGAVAVKLFALASVAYCIVATQTEVPLSLKPWLNQLSAISVSFVRYADNGSRIVTMWGDHTVAHTINQRLHPIMMAKSLIHLGVTTPPAVEAICKQFVASPVSFRVKLQGKLGVRMQNLVDKTKLPGPNWIFLVSHYASAGGVDNRVAYSDRYFDHAGFYVGNSAVRATFVPFLLELSMVTPASQLMTLKQAVVARTVFGGRWGDNAWSRACKINAFNFQILALLLQRGHIPTDVVDAVTKAATENLDHPWTKSMEHFADARPDIAPEDPAEWAKEFTWVQNLLADTVARERPQETLEHVRLERASSEQRVAAAVQTLQSELLEFEGNVASRAVDKQQAEAKAEKHARKRNEVAKEAISAAAFAGRFVFEQRSIRGFGRNGLDSVQCFLGDVAALADTNRDKVAVATIMDLTNTVISNALLHELATFLAGLPEDAFHLILYSARARGFFKNHNPESSAASSSVPDDEAEPTADPAAGLGGESPPESEDEASLLADLELPPAKQARVTYRRTLAQEFAQLARDRALVDEQLGRNKMDLRAPVPIALRAQGAEGKRQMRDGFALMPVCDRRDGQTWCAEMDLFTTRCLSVVESERVVCVGRASAMKAGAEVPKGCVETVARRMATPTQRRQCGPCSWKPVLDDLAKAAKTNGKAALAVIVPFSGVGDVAMQTYSMHRDSCQTRHEGDTFLACFSMESNARYHTLARTRLRAEAFADFSDEKLLVPGYVPFGRLPAASAHSNAEAFVDECRRHAKYVVYYVATVGAGESARTEPCAKVPTLEKFNEMVRGELNEQQEAVYNKWVAK